LCGGTLEIAEVCATRQGNALGRDLLEKGRNRKVGVDCAFQRGVTRRIRRKNDYQGKRVDDQSAS